MSLAEQMGNIGSEIAKAFYWKEKNKKQANQIAEQVFELFDLTIIDKRRRHKLSEILKLRSVFCDCFFNLGNFNVDPAAIEKYFIPFALLANRSRWKRNKEDV